jgi:sugar transferase EpsL
MREAERARELDKRNHLTIPRQAPGSAAVQPPHVIVRTAQGSPSVGQTRSREGDSGPLGEGKIATTGPAQNATGWRRYRGKRLLDLTILALVTLPALAIGIISAIAILVDDGRPVLFRQLRTGRDGQPFVLLKLRTMINITRQHDALPGPGDFTRIGRILRRTSIDELPQLVNILRGDMSIVGPRPTLPYQVQRYDSRQFGRLRVRPGLTGLAQINGRNQMTWSERIEWDLRYVEHQSLWLDLGVLARTVLVILTGEGVSGHPSNDPIVRS